jgi:hypothetical protein
MCFASTDLIPAEISTRVRMIKLSDYSPPIVRFIKANQFACLYVFAVDGHRPCKVGHALNLRHRHGLVQEGHVEEITIECVIWCPSAATAALISEDVRHRLGVSAGRAGWWNVEPAVAIDVLRRARAQFPSRGIVEHTAFIAQAAPAGFSVPAVKFA